MWLLYGIAHCRIKTCSDQTYQSSNKWKSYFNVYPLFILSTFASPIYDKVKLLIKRSIQAILNSQYFWKSSYPFDISTRLSKFPVNNTELRTGQCIYKYIILGLPLQLNCITQQVQNTVHKIQQVFLMFTFHRTKRVLKSASAAFHFWKSTTFLFWHFYTIHHRHLFNTGTFLALILKWRFPKS